MPLNSLMTLFLDLWDDLCLLSAENILINPNTNLNFQEMLQLELVYFDLMTRQRSVSFFCILVLNFYVLVFFFVYLFASRGGGDQWML